jgi:hypothetical protein
MITAFFFFLGVPSVMEALRKPAISKIKEQLFDLKGSLEELNKLTVAEELPLRLSRHATYQGQPHYFGRCTVNRADLLLPETRKKQMELMFVIGPVRNFSGEDDPELKRLAVELLLEKIQWHRRRAVQDFLFK